MFSCTLSDIASVSKDVLGMMMLARDEKTGQGLTDTELRDQVITLMLAGHEVGVVMCGCGYVWVWLGVGVARSGCTL